MDESSQRESSDENVDSSGTHDDSLDIRNEDENQEAEDDMPSTSG